MTPTLEIIAQIISILALVTGIPYMIFEVLQKNAMWYFGFFTGLTSAIMFAIQRNWASMCLNVYYVFMAVWGLYQWKKDSALLKSGNEKSHASATIHLNHISGKMAWGSIAGFVLMFVFLLWALRLLGDPAVVLDALSTSLCVVAMVWLAKSIPWHWVLWIIGDILLVVMCFVQGNYWLTAMYAVYVAASVYGLFLWRKNGSYVG